MSNSAPPIHEIRAAGIRATIWRNSNPQGRVWYSVTFAKNYRQADQWKESSSFCRDDLPALSKASEMAYAWIWQELESQRKPSRVGE